MVRLFCVLSLVFFNDNYLIVYDFFTFFLNYDLMNGKTILCT